MADDKTPPAVNNPFQANRDVLSDPNKISPGQNLRIP